MQLYLSEHQARGYADYSGLGRTYAKQTLALLRSLAGRDNTSMCYLLRGQAARCLNSPLRPRRTFVLSSAPRLASAILRKSY